MDVDFEESLPSYSNLVAASRNGIGVYDSQERQSVDLSQFGKTENYDYHRPSSPPPPPPPLSAFEDQPVRRMSAPAGKSNTNDSAKGNEKGRPSFPFLKKQSRKEPSALHRSPRSPASTSSSPIPASNDITNQNGKSFHDRNGLQDVQQRLHDDGDSEEEGGDVFLSGTGYWQADDMKATQKTSRAAVDSSMRVSHGNGVADALDSSTINIGGDQWQQQRAEGQEELDEFELIERQLENSSLANTYGAVNKSLANSSHFHSKQANIAVSSRPEPVKQTADDWSDAYEHDPFAKTKNNQREGTKPQYHSYNAAESTNRFDKVDANKDSEEEQYAEDFSGSEEEDIHFHKEDPQSARRISTHDSPVRQSVSDYIDSTSPAHRNQREQEQDFDSYSSKPSARPSYSNHWDVQSDSPTQDRADRTAAALPVANHPSAVAPAMRATESPSWGRSTQPVRHSFSENEGTGSEQDDIRADFASTSRAAEGAKMARMSNSALRKISSRTAALHGQGQTPVSRLERPSLADDAQRNTRDAFSDAEEEKDTAPQEVIYTRPTPVRRASGPAASLAGTGAGAGAARGGAKPRSSSTGGRLRPGATGPAGATTGVDGLSEKAQALEQELQTYRNENAQLKKLRRQQETSLAEVVHQKEELMRWVAEEKAKTLKWCEEQTQAATKERNAAAKLARDSRQKALSGTMPIRKEKAEMEALQATIEKMKVDHEAAAKKWKLAEARLYSLIKEHTAHIESSEKQLLAVEQEKLMLLEYIGEQGLRLPKQLRGSLQRTPLYRTSPDAHSRGSAVSGSVAQDVLRGKSPGNRSKYPGDRGYAEEVDVEFGDATTTVHSAAAVRVSGATTSSASGSVGRSATPTNRSSGKLSATYQPGEMLNRQSSNLKTGVGGTSSVRPVTSSGSRVADMIGASGNTGSSWARSSRSSTGSAGRYDHADAEDNSDVYNSADLGGLLRRSQSEDSHRAGPQGSAKCATKPTNSHGPPNVPMSSSSASQPKSPGYTASTSFKSTVPASLQQSATVNLGATGAAGGNSRTEETLPNGKKLIKYKNGTQKEIDEAGNSLVRFLNGDTKSVNATNGVVVYYYAQADTTHTTFKDGLEVYEFPNKQVEMHFPDGIKEIIFPDSTRKVINPDGLQESHFPDGVILREHADGRREVLSAKDT